MRRIPFVANTNLPRQMYKHPQAPHVEGEWDVSLTRGSKLFCKVLLFLTKKDMEAFWKNVLRMPLSGKSQGCVHFLGYEVRCPIEGRLRMEGDARYYCVMGLLCNYLTPEIISHESVHAAYCYHKRVRRNLFATVEDMDEEHIAYPTGRICEQVTRALKQKGYI